MSANERDVGDGEDRVEISNAGLLGADEAVLGQQIREMRLARGLSIKELSRRSEVSAGTISQIERGLVSPSIRSLRNICHSLGVPISVLFHPSGYTAEMESHYIRREHQRDVLRLGYGTVKEILSARSSEKLELLLVNIEPGGSSGPDTYSHEGEEMGIVVSGVLDLWIANQQFRLREGDSFGFASTLPHRFGNSGSTDCRVLWINSPPLYGSS
jgi:transcriptional regulator with XRE-family HTH domain